MSGPTHAYFGANAGCWHIYGEVLAREYNDPEKMKLHRLTVDAYAVQHPGKPEPRTIQSVSVHLLSLYFIFEKGVHPEQATPLLGTLIQKHRDHFVWLTPPNHLGAITVADIWKISTTQEHLETVKEWAHSAWKAWSEHHSYIAQLAKTSR
jgi:hypothetical protein